MNNLIVLLDIAIGAMETVGRVNQLIATARAEGRDVTDEEVQALIDQSAELRAQWDSAGGE